MNAEYLTYPPQLSADVEIVEQESGKFIAGSAASGRFILIGEVERRVLQLLTEGLPPGEICEEFRRRHQAKLTLSMLGKFLDRLDRAGMLAGNRAIAPSASDPAPGPRFYLRWKLFDPDRLFEKIVARAGWIWTGEFAVATLFVMNAALLLFLMRAAEIASYTLYTMREHYLAVFLASLLVGLSHEFAHGLTCKAFRGRVPEIGILLIYHVLPALYCNVSSAYLIAGRRRRLWVIAAGLYWQALVGAIALLGWSMVEPYTLLSDLAFALFLGSVLDLLLNANPLIKLDGYYFLSQLLRLPNLAERSRSYLSSSLERVLAGQKIEEPKRRSGRREQAIYAVFGLASFAFTLGLRAAIVIYAGSYLADRFDLGGLMAAGILGLFYIRRPIGQLMTGMAGIAKRVLNSLAKATRGEAMGDRGSKEERSGAIDRADGVTATGGRRKRWVWIGAALFCATVLCAPWTASVGSYGVLVALPDREVVIRAPESATLIELTAQPGEWVARGGVIGRMGNIELDEQIVEAETEMARARLEYERLSGELRVREEEEARAGLELDRQRYEFKESQSEQEQIEKRRTAERAMNVAEPAMNVRMASLAVTASGSSNHPANHRANYPAAIAVLEADVRVIGERLEEATAQERRARELFQHGVIARSEMEAAETKAAALSLELGKASERLEAALIEHRRKYTGSSIALAQAGSALRAERLQFELLASQIEAARRLIETLGSRLDLLARRQAQFELVSPVAGMVYGEELPRMLRRHFDKGEEICRVADNRQLLLRIQLPEREIDDVRVGNGVRVKVRAYSDRVFRGAVSRLGGEGERDEHGRTTYRVELAIDNEEGLLRPGMTAFARIDFGRMMIGRIVAHKVRQLLRPELWML